MQIDDDLKGLLDHMSDAMKDAIRGSEKLQELLHEIENRGYTPSLTVGVVLARTGTGEREIGRASCRERVYSLV